MSLPSLTKTYEFSVNQQIPAQASLTATCRKIWRQVVTTLLGMTSGAWTVDYSCDSSVAGSKGDGVNRWAADSNLVWGASNGAHSWIVLSCDGPMTGFQLLIACEGSNNAGAPRINQITIALSYGAGFTGGTTTARPTATDEYAWSVGDQASNAGSWHGYGYLNATNFSSVLNTWHSTDGQITRITLMIGNVTQFVFFMERVNPQIAAWTTPGIGGFFSNAGAGVAVETITYANLVRATKVGSRLSVADTSKFYCYMTVEGCNSSTIGELQTFQDDDSAEWPMLPVGLYSPTASHRGRKGLMIDFWLGSTQVNTGDTYPDDASKQFAQFGVGVYPWNGSTPVTA